MILQCCPGKNPEDAGLHVPQELCAFKSNSADELVVPTLVPGLDSSGTKSPDGDYLMAPISLKVNGHVYAVDVDPETPLLYVLSDELQLRGPKFGCGLAQCGACTVMIQGEAVRSCSMPLKALKQDEVTTLEGLGTPEKPHAIQQAFIDEGAAQCGFCLSGVILTAKALLDRNPKASDEQIHEAMSNVLCRCFAHVRMMRAIKRYQGRRA